MAELNSRNYWLHTRELTQFGNKIQRKNKHKTSPYLSFTAPFLSSVHVYHLTKIWFDYHSEGLEVKACFYRILENSSLRWKTQGYQLNIESLKTSIWALKPRSRPFFVKESGWDVSQLSKRKKGFATLWNRKNGFDWFSFKSWGSSKRSLAQRSLDGNSHTVFMFNCSTTHMIFYGFVLLPNLEFVSRRGKNFRYWPFRVFITQL